MYDPVIYTKETNANMCKMNIIGRQESDDNVCVWEHVTVQRCEASLLAITVVMLESIQYFCL